MPAPAPSRKSGTIPVTIGMVTMTLDLFSSAEESATRRSSYVRIGDELHPVGMTSYDKVTGSNIEKSEIVKCVEASDGTLVEVSDEEMHLVMAEDGVSEFIGFLDNGTFRSEYVIEKKYQVRPTTKIANKTVKVSPFAKPFAVFLEGMRQTNSVGIVKYVSRGNPKYYALLPDGSFFSLLYDEEVREDRPLPIVDLTDEEKAMGVKLVQKFTVDSTPVLTDETSTKVAALVEAKAEAIAKGEAFALPVAAEPTESTGGDDFMAAMMASL